MIRSKQLPFLGIRICSVIFLLLLLPFFHSPDSCCTYAESVDSSPKEFESARYKTGIAENSKLLGLEIFADTTKPRRITVSTASDFKKAVPLLLPGDTLELAAGTYDLGGSLSLTRSGTSALPIIIRSQTRGTAVFTNKSYFTLKGIEYLTIEGFTFTSTDVTAIKTESCNNIRITRNTFRLKETASDKWVLIGGTYNLADPKSHHNRIDHNLFEEKHQLGNCITIDGSPNPTAKSSQYDRIDHNYFRNVGPRAENEMETIRIGWSAMSMSSGYTTVEYNLFENCDGDPEIVSVKTCDDTIRYNTIISSQGTICLRHGNRSIVEGNFFLGKGKAGTGGVRIYGDDHKIFNNYFEGLAGERWDAAITITNGDADYPSGSLSDHFRPRRGTYAFNTLVNNLSNIEIGYTSSGSYKKPPSDNIIANNLVIGSSGQLIKIITSPINMSWSGNIMFPKDSAFLGIILNSEQIRTIDPLVNLDNGLWKLSSASPAINNSSSGYDFVVYDIEGQKRDSVKDTGADEYSTSGNISNRPLTPKDVGPDAEEKLSEVRLCRIKSTPSDYLLDQNYPNPFNPSTAISYRIEKAGITSLSIFDLTGKKVADLINEYQPAGKYVVKFNAANLSSGTYLYELKVNGLSLMKKMLLIK